MDLLNTLRNLLISPERPDPLDRLRLARSGNTNMSYIDLALPPEGSCVGGGRHVILARVNDAILTRFFERNRSSLAGKSFKKIAAHQEAFEVVGSQLRDLDDSDGFEKFRAARMARLRKGEVVPDDTLGENEAYRSHLRRQSNTLEVQALELAVKARADVLDYLRDCLDASEAERARAEKTAKESPLGINPLCYPEPILTLGLSVFFTERLEEASRPVESYQSPRSMLNWPFEVYAK